MSVTSLSPAILPASPARPSLPSVASGPPVPPVDLAALGDVVTGLAGATHLWRPAADAAPATRDGLRLLATPDYEVWLLTWPAGSRVQPHDHGAAHGAFVVVSGELCEIRWAQARRRHRVLREGDTAQVGVGVVHDVVAVGESPACSIHAYSPPLEEMRFYATDGAGPRSAEAVETGAGVLDPLVVSGVGASVRRDA